MKAYNIYMSGVGGQGIGLLSEVLLRAADHAGYAVKAVDTHGLAQRGGIVVSHLRIGETVYTPLVPAGSADLAICLERHEALRALNLMCRKGGVLVYYDTVWQPLDVRLGKAKEVTAGNLAEQCERAGVTLVRVHKPDLPDVRMQNVAVLARISRDGLVQGIEPEHYHQAMDDLMAGGLLAKNQELFEKERNAA